MIFKSIKELCNKIYLIKDEIEGLKELFYTLKDRYDESQKIEDNNFREEEEGEIYDELIEFISLKYYDIYLQLEEIYYDERLMDIFDTSTDERNFIERVIKEYPIDVRSLISTEQIIKEYINKNI